VSGSKEWGSGHSDIANRLKRERDGGRGDGVQRKGEGYDTQEDNLTMIKSLKVYILHNTRQLLLLHLLPRRDSIFLSSFFSFLRPALSFPAIL